MLPSSMMIGSPSSRAPNTSVYHSIAAAGSCVARYGVIEWRRAGVYSRISGIGCSSRVSCVAPSASDTRRRSSAANAGRGASGTFGSRRESNGSVVIAFTSRVGNSERVARAHEKGFGRVHGAVEVLRHLRHRQPVEIPERERGAVVRPELLEHLVGARPLEPLVGVVGHDLC